MPESFVNNFRHILPKKLVLQLLSMQETVNFFDLQAKKHISDVPTNDVRSASTGSRNQDFSPVIHRLFDQF